MTLACWQNAAIKAKMELLVLHRLEGPVNILLGVKDVMALHLVNARLILPYFPIANPIGVLHQTLTHFCGVVMDLSKESQA